MICCDGLANPPARSASSTCCASFFRHTAIAELQDVITAAGGKLLRRVDLFDIYRGKGVAEGKKSVAFSLVLRADDRTLTDADSEGVTSKVLAALEAKLGAVLR